MEDSTTKPLDTDKQDKFNLLKSTEGKILITALCLIFLYCVYLAVLFVITKKTFQLVVGMTATHLAFGRAAGMSFGYTMGLGNAFVILINMIIETLVVVLFYPLFVLSWKKLLIIKRLNDFMEKVRANAEKNEKIIKRFGIVALPIFVFIPFWMTGPLVGSAIGFLIGLSWWVTFISVLGGTYVAIFVWAYLLKELHEKISHFGPFAPLVVLGLIILLAIIHHVMKRFRKKK